MIDEKRKQEPPLKLAMGFGEALSRFVATNPEQVAQSVERSKTKKSPQDGSPRRPERSTNRQNETIKRVQKKQS